MGVFEGKALYFCVGGGGWLFFNPVGGCFSIQSLFFNPVGGCFSIQWVVVLRENIILLVVVLLKNAVLWVSFVQMGSCGLLRFKYKEE